MYLNDLNDAQKALVLDLLIQAIPEGWQNDPGSRERIERICTEMGVAPRYSEQLVVDAALPMLLDISSTVTMRKVLVELAILAMPFQEYETMVRTFNDKYAPLTGLQRSEFEEILRLLEEISRASQRLDELVNEPV
jgi:hypothetical protein